MPERDEQGREKYMRGQPREVDRGALQSHLILSSSPEGEIGGPRSDPMSIRAWKNKQPFPGRLAIGKVVDVYPSFGMARVFAGKTGLVPAILPASSFGLTGTRFFHSIHEGTTVLLYLDPKGASYILAPLPDQPGVGSLFLPEWLIQGGGAHMYSEKGEYPTLKGNKSVRMLPNRPIVFDAQGEELITTPTGMTFHFDPFLASIHLSEFTGIFLFLWDHLLRLGAINMEFLTPTSIQKLLTLKEGFMGNIRMSGLHLSDLIGRRYWEVDENDLKKIKEDPTLGYWRPGPEDWADRSFYRVLELEGAMSMGKTMFMAAQGVDRDKLDSRVWPATQIDHASYEGARVISASTTLAFMKHPLLPVPVLERPIEDLREEDVSSNVGFETPDLGNYDLNKPIVQNIVERLSDHIYRNFKKYSENWKVPDEEDFDLEIEYAPELSWTGFCYRQDMAVSSIKKVTHWYKAPWDEYGTPYSAPMDRVAGIFILRDGGILISDGAGSEIIMRGGHIHISCPGTMAISSGTSTLLLGGTVDVVGQTGVRIGSNEGNLLLQTSNLEVENLEVKNVLLANILSVEKLVVSSLRAGSVCSTYVTATASVKTNNLDVYGKATAPTPFFEESSGGSLANDSCSDPNTDDKIMQARSSSNCQTKFPDEAYLIMPRWAYTSTKDLGEMKGEVLDVYVVGPKTYLPLLVKCDRPCQDND